jgi:hypothetical protein
MIRRLAIYKYRKGDSANTLHNSVDQITRKTHSSKSFFNKNPFKPVISLGHVKLNAHKTFFLVSVVLKVMKGFKSQQSVVCDKSARQFQLKK